MINYNIIWFEDTKSFYTSTSKRLLKKFEDSDLNLVFQLSKGAGIIKEMDASSDVDLILMDHNLFQTKGNLLINRIREKKLLTEIVYYSQDAKLKDNVDNVEGLYFSSKVNLFSVASKIISKTTRPINEVSVQRGSFISEVILLEEKMILILLKYFLISKTGMEEEFRKRIVESEFFSTGEKYKIIQRVINEKLALIKDKNSKAFKDLNALKTIFSKFQIEVIQVRNKLAHAKETIVEGVAKFITSDGEEFEITESGIKSGRKKLKKHSDNLDELITHF